MPRFDRGGPLLVCPHCGSHGRPGVVWFGEALDLEVLRRAVAATECDRFLTVGASVGDDPLNRIAGSGQRISAASSLLLDALLPPVADDADEHKGREEACARKAAEAA